MSTYTFTVGSTPKSIAGTLTWNQNGSLRTLAITDAFNSGGAQTCNFGTSTVMGYDDLGRLLSANCGSPWSQAFTYDQFGNISKTGSLTWACTACYNGNNQYNNVLSSLISYDADGNLLNDTFHTYSWDAYGHPSTIDATTCGSNGTCLTYDALGRMVEKNVSGVYTEVLYSPAGKTAIMSGQTTSSAYFPLPAGETLYETGSTGSTQYFWHKDWLGSARFASSLSGRSSYYDRAYAPFGETYSNFGNTSGNNFTGDTQDTVSGTYDTPNRELNPNQGRWISPDPAGLGAVDPGNPQSWNRYAYVENNPTSFIDPSGLVDIIAAMQFFASGGGGGGWQCVSVSGLGQTTVSSDGLDSTCNIINSIISGGAGSPDTLPLSFFTPGGGMCDLHGLPTEGGDTWYECTGAILAANNGTPTTPQKTPCAVPSGKHLSMGVSVNGATVNPFTSGGGGVLGGNQQSFGPTTYNYTYSGGGAGLDVGASIQSVWAYGSGSWTGPFQSINVSFSWFTASIFRSTDGAWHGVTFGLGVGAPGASYEVTNYTCKSGPG